MSKNINIHIFLSQLGADSGRHEWFKWHDGPTPEGNKTTQAINIFDLMLLSVQSGVDTAEFQWREPKPCSEKVTRVLGTKSLHSFYGQRSVAEA